MDFATLFLFLVFFVLGYVVREFIGGSKKEKPEDDGKGDTVMRFWLDDQQVQHINLEGKDLSVTDLAPDERKRLTEVLSVMQKWAQSEEPVKAPAPVVAAAAVAISPADEPLPTPVEIREETKPRLDLAKGARMFFTDNVARKVEPKPKTIIDMINDVLQKKLETSPLQSKKIKMEEGPHGEVVVAVGADHYMGVDQVPDPEVQAIIKQAIAEWEHTQT
jgi:hypothetical protein